MVLANPIAVACIYSLSSTMYIYTVIFTVRAQEKIIFVRTRIIIDKHCIVVSMGS